MASAANPNRPRIVAGCMTGTSLDGLDVALVRIDGHGLAMKPTLIGHHAVSMPSDLRDTLMHLASGNAAEPIVYLRAARQLGLYHAEGLAQLFAKHPDEKPDFITAHGQTIWHAPKEDEHLGPMSWQLFDPWPIVQRHKLPVCYDLRQADLIAGGEGAPLTPIADWVMYREYADMVINLGGVANYTWLVGGFDHIGGGDLCECNLLLDGLCQRLVGLKYDFDGRLSEKGKYEPELSDVINTALIDCRQTAQLLGQKSLGREAFSEAWFASLIAYVEPMGCPEDILRTAAKMVANRVCSGCDLIEDFTNKDTGHQYRVVLAGGGARNLTLVKELRERVAWGNNESQKYQYEITVSDDLGIPCEAREAMGWAVLGALSQDAVAVSLPQVTGALGPGVAGVWAGV